MWDLLLKNALVIDPINAIHGIKDIAIENGKIAEISDQLPGQAHHIDDWTGHVLIPGIIDMHTHLRTLWGSPHGQRMVALAGVTTAMDMAGPLDNILDSIPTSGAGINMAILQQATAPFTFTTNRPNLAEQEKMICDSLSHGALGIKLLGGHYPMDIDICDQLIQKAHQHNAWIAWHAGNSQHGSNILGMKDAVELSNKGFLHLAHVNSYCRGQIKNENDEAIEAVTLLKQHPNVYSESYLSPNNGTRLTCKDGIPITKVTCTCLQHFGYDPTEKGLAQALLDGVVGVVVDNGTTSDLVYGKEAYHYWLFNHTVVSACFAVNPWQSRLTLLGARRENNSFVVDSISTDGGALPRNVIIELGLSAVKLGVISLEDFVIKTSVNPSRVLRLKNKGHLTVGADADITIIEFSTQKAKATIVDGHYIMKKGQLMGHGTKILCTIQAKHYLTSRGINHQILDLSENWNRFIPQK